MTVEELPDYLSPALREKWETIITDLAEATEDEFKFVESDALLDQPASMIRGQGSAVELGSVLQDRNEQENLDWRYNGLNPNLYYVVMSGRQGGGNRECYCDNGPDVHEDGCLFENNETLEMHPNYLFDYDDPSERTYNTFVFDNDITEATHLAFTKKNDRAAYLNKIQTKFKAVKSGELPWWSLNEDFDNTGVFNYKHQAGKFVSLEAREDELQATIAKEDYYRSFLNSDQLLSSLPEGLLAYFGGANVNVRYIQGLYTEYKDSVVALDKMEAAMSEAENLPDDSPLKDFLLGDRGSFEYTGTEKRGRKTVKVRKTVQRDPLLVKELESARRSVSLAKSSWDRVKETSFKTPYAVISARRDLDMLDQLRPALIDKREELWMSGWDGEGHPPPVSDNFAPVPQGIFDPWA